MTTENKVTRIKDTCLSRRQWKSRENDLVKQGWNRAHSKHVVFQLRRLFRKQGYIEVFDGEYKVVKDMPPPPPGSNPYISMEKAKRDVFGNEIKN